LYLHDIGQSATCRPFRAFDRMHTEFLATLQEGLSNTEFALAETRIPTRELEFQ